MGASPPSDAYGGLSSDPEAGGRAGSGLSASVRAHPFLIGIVTLVAVVAAFVASATRASTYEASAQVLVTPIPEAERTLPQLPLLRASSDRTRVIQTAANLLDSPAAAALTASRLGPGWTADRVASMVDVLPEGESDILAVTAQASDPEVAARVANEFAAAALDARAQAIGPIIEKRIAQIQRDLRAEADPSSPTAVDLAERLASVRALSASDGDPTLSLTQTADAPVSSAGPSNALLLVVSIVAGLAVGLGCALVIDMVGPRRVSDAAQAVAASGVPVLGRVPALTFWQRTRRSEPLRFRPAAAAALRLVQYQLELQPGERRQLLFAGGSTGDGVTTTVGELGLTLARAGREVLIVDLNPVTPDLATRLGVPQAVPLGTALEGHRRWESAAAAVPEASKLRVLTVGAYGPLGIPDDVASELLRVLSAARERFDYVLIDAPPLVESGEALRVSSVVDAVVLVVRLGRTRLVDLETTLALLEQARRTPAGLLLVGGRAPAPPADRAAIGLPAERPSTAAALHRSAEA